MKKSIGSQRTRKLQFLSRLIDNSKYIYDLLLLKTLTSSYVFSHYLGLYGFLQIFGNALINYLYIVIYR